MPHGRANLDQRMVDLYLIRQPQQRKLRYTQDGSLMPQWPDSEVRRVLGFIAWQSQQAPRLRR